MDVGSVIKKHFNYRGMVFGGRPHQSRLPVRTFLRIHIGSVSQ